MRDAVVLVELQATMMMGDAPHFSLYHTHLHEHICTPLDSLA